MTYTLETKKSWAECEADIKAELGRWGALTYSLTRGRSPAEPTGPKSVKSQSRTSWSQTPEQATVTLVAHWPDSAGRPDLVIKYNKQKRDVDNARVIFLVIESIRKNEVRGLGDVLRETYAQLPPGEAQSVRKRPPHEVLEILPGSPLAVAEAAYKVKAQAAHPDRGGSNEAMAELNAAIEELRAR